MEDRQQVTKNSWTWQEISKHNTEQSVWVYLGNDVYDVTSFLPKHPGGKDMLLLMAGRDITDLFESYHPFTKKPKQILKSYKIGTLFGPSEFGTFKKDTGFYKECKEKVCNYFAENNIDYKSPYAGLWRYIFILCMIFSCYWLAWNTSEYKQKNKMAPFGIIYVPFMIRFILMIIAGVFQGMLLIHTMHDCSHTAFSHKPYIWKYIGRICLDLVCGCSFDAWLHQHVVGHHVYTNIIAVDPDCPPDKKGDIRRVCDYQEWSWAYKTQWIYLPILYCLYAFKNRIQDLTHTLFGAHNGPIRVNPEFRNSESLLRQLTCKSFWFIRAIIFPLYLWNNDFFYEFLPLFLCMELTTGYFLTYNFQVSHVSTDVNWPIAEYDNETNKLLIDGEWAKLQIETSVDYAHNSLLCTFFSGALNYQSVHHLFPCVSQYHYPMIAPIIKDVCKAYNVKFNHIPTFMEAFYRHIKQLKDMGEEPKPKPKSE